jgi:hypothetical protein
VGRRPNANRGRPAGPFPPQARPDHASQALVAYQQVVFGARKAPRSYVILDLALWRWLRPGRSLGGRQMPGMLNSSISVLKQLRYCMTGLEGIAMRARRRQRGTGAAIERGILTPVQQTWRGGAGRDLAVIVWCPLDCAVEIALHRNRYFWATQAETR